MSTNRIFTPQEKNFLKKHNFDFNQKVNHYIPVEYLVNISEFKGHTFYVNKDVLIPRIETETLVDLAVSRIDKSKPVTILDLCTGSGCIGISISSILSETKTPHVLYLTDISQKALRIAKINAKKILSNETKVYFIQSNLFEKIPKINFDLIVSNPPYIPSKNIPHLDKSVKDFEPHLALDGGLEGTTLINKIISFLPQYQSKINTIIEIDDSHNLKKINSGSLNSTLFKDQFGVNRFISFSSSKPFSLL